MNPNPIRGAVDAGKTLYGTWIEMVPAPGILKLMKSAGLDFARVDMEHSPFNMESIASMALLARAIDFPIMVRPPEANREWITRLLDAGVWNLHCPQVDNPKVAASIVEATRYYPMGSRGMFGEGPAVDFEYGGTRSDKLAFANEQVFITVMLETKEAFANLDEIASMPGIDALTLGPSDLSQDLGVFGKPEAAEVLDEHRYRVVEAAKKHGKTSTMLVGSPEQAKKWRDAGVQLLGYSSDIGILSAGYRRFLDSMRTD